MAPLKIQNPDELLAIPLGCQKTPTKWLVISETRREQKIATPRTIGM